MDIKVNREAIIDKAKRLPENIVVIEAIWDGDSLGWHVRIDAIEETRDGDYKFHLLGIVAHSLGEFHDFARAYVGETPPYPEGLIAQEVANSLGVPLYFPSPEKPVDLKIPQWIDYNEGRVSSIPIHLIDKNDYDSILQRFKSSHIAAIEAYWSYYIVWHPHLAVITAQNPESKPLHYIAHKVGRLYWDEHDQGRTLFGVNIPSRTPVEQALYIGERLAKEFNTEFYFGEPDNPRRNIPRWIDLQNSEQNND